MVKKMEAREDGKIMAEAETEPTLVGIHLQMRR